MVKVSPFFFFAVSAPLLSIVQAGSCDLDPTIPTTCTGKDGWYPISVVGRGVYCTKGPNVCVADNSNGDCPSAQAGLEFGSKCDSLAPGVYGCFPKDSCNVSTQENAVVQSPPQTGCDVVDDGTPESDKVKTDPPTYTPTLPPVKEDGILPSTPAPYGSRKEDAPVSSYGSPEGAPAGSPGDSPTPTPTIWMVDVPEYRSEPDSSSPAEGNTPPSYNSPGGAPTDIPALTPSGKPEDALVDTPAPTPCESTPADVPAPTTSGKPEDALADTPAPTPCESTPVDVPAPTTSGKPEDALADTPAPTPCESTESPADTPAPTTSEAAPSNSPAPADGPTQEQQEAAPIDTTSAPADSPTQEQQQELAVVPTPTAENDGIDYSLDLGDRRLRH